MNELILSDYLSYKDFKSEKELEVFNQIIYECDPKKMKDNGFADIFDTFMSGFVKPAPIWHDTLHENIFHRLFPFLEKQVVIGLGKGSYEKYKVKKYTLDFFNREDNIAWEIDGKSHISKIQKLKDEKRDIVLFIEFGIETKRVTNKFVEELLLERIRKSKVVEMLGN